MNLFFCLSVLRSPFLERIGRPPICQLQRITTLLKEKRHKHTTTTRALRSLTKSTLEIARLETMGLPHTHTHTHNTQGYTHIYSIYSLRSTGDIETIYAHALPATKRLSSLLLRTFLLYFLCSGKITSFLRVIFI